MFFPEKKLHKNLFKFEKKSESSPNIFVSRVKIFVCLEIDGKYLIKIFKFLDKQTKKKMDNFFFFS